MLKKTLVALAVAGSALPAVSFAADSNPLSFNASLVTDYRYRGVSQSRLQPALQGGADYVMPNGVYFGAWASTIKWIKDGGGGGNLEIDLYGGYKGEIKKDLSYDVGFLQYVYPGNKLATSPNTLEIYGALTFGPATAKYSHSLTNLFGVSDSKGSGYLDVSASFDVGMGVTLVPHVGMQRVAHNSAISYSDYSLTASKDVSGFSLSAALVATQTKNNFEFTGPGGKDNGKAGIVLSAKKTF